MSDVQPTFEDLMGPQVVADEPLEAGIKLAAHDLFLRLQGTFSPPAYITLEEVRDATGFDGTRTADAMAISLYRSRGKSLWGFEFKVSRNDWLKELKQPEKSETILRYCHHWALVVPDKAIVKDGELPSSWGLYVAQKNRLKCVVPAPMLEPIPLDMRMFTAICYAVDQRNARADAAALSKARDEGYKSGVKSTHGAWYEDQYNKMMTTITAFEKASGLNIQCSRVPERIGEVVKLIINGDAPLKRLLDTAQYNLTKTEDLKVEIEKQIKVLEAAMKNEKLQDDEE